MEKELIQFIRENNLSPFNKHKTSLKSSETIFKTKDAKAIFNKVISVFSSNFSFSDTSNLFNYLKFTDNFQEIEKRQNFFKKYEKQENSFLNQINIPKAFWRPKYDVLVVTEDEKTFKKLSDLSCPVKFICSQSDVETLENYDIIQVIDCETLSIMLEQLPQTVFLNSIDEVYLERYVEILSSWKDNLLVLQNANNEIKTIIQNILPLMPLLENKISDKISRENVEDKLTEINENLSEEIDKLTIPGTKLMQIMSGNIPEEIERLIESKIKETNLPLSIFEIKIPVKIDEQSLDDLIKKQNANEFTELAEKIRKHADLLQELPKLFKELEEQLLVFDFISGLKKFSGNFPKLSNNLEIQDSSNLFLENAQPISFHLNQEYLCSILTGANSGGKTTLIEHIIQLITMFNLGLPVSGKVKLPAFTEVYYFAKNKGSVSKGAFETLLTTMSKITPGKQTLILADEIEAVTEPGVAGSIICSTAEYFIEKSCFIILATHLGKEIQRNLPKKARIDGIEAKGLTENFELIVDHNPVIGKLASSTPELIVEKMASLNRQEDYFKFIYERLKRGSDKS